MNTSRRAERKAAAKQARRRPLLSLLTRNFAINVHKSPSDETHVACGEIPSGSQAMPATGHPRGLSEEVFLPGLAVLASLVLLGGLLLRRRATP